MKLIIGSLIILLMSISYLNIRSTSNLVKVPKANSISMLSNPDSMNKFKENIVVNSTSNTMSSVLSLMNIDSPVVNANTMLVVNMTTLMSSTVSTMALKLQVMTTKLVSSQLHMLVPNPMILSGTMQDHFLAMNIITGQKLISSSSSGYIVEKIMTSDDPLSKSNDSDSIDDLDDEYMISKKVYKSSQTDDNIDDLKTGLDSTIDDDVLDKDELIYSKSNKQKAINNASSVYSGIKEPLILPWFILLGLLVVLVILLKFVSKPKL